MSQISPPIRILLVCAVAFMAAWMLFLRPSTDAGTPAADDPVPAANAAPVETGGADAESAAGKAVEAANNATAAADERVERIENGTETAADARQAANATEPKSSAPSGAEKAASPGAPAAEAAATSGLPLRVLKGIADRKVIALLFWSPKSVDDQQVRKALRGIDRHDGKVMAHATHIKRIAAYEQITRGANVEQSPTVVIIDRDRTVQTLVGFVDRTSIDQAVADALRKK